MPFYTIMEERQVEYDLLIEYDAGMLKCFPVGECIQGANSILRAGTYRTKDGTVTVPKGQTACVATIVEGNTPEGPFRVIFMRLCEEAKIPGALPTFHPRSGYFGYIGSTAGQPRRNYGRANDGTE